MGASRRSTAFLLLMSPIAFVIVVIMAWPTAASAQCGSSASSCKNCHEVQGEYPVNASGDWHVSHAFGDFCEFCHAGNVQATEADTAHTGMVYPLDDVNTSCLSCHPDDVMQKAEVYAVALNVTAGTASGSGDSRSTVEEPQGGQQAVETEQVETSYAETQGEIIDFNSQYARTVLDEGPPVNVGNVILVVMAFGLTALGGSLVWRWEGLGERWRLLRAHPETAAGSASMFMQQSVSARGVEVQMLGDFAAQQPVLYPEVANVIQKLDLATMPALQQVMSDAEAGNAMIRALARLDPQLVRRVAKLDAHERALLIALAALVQDDTP